MQLRSIRLFLSVIAFSRYYIANAYAPGSTIWRPEFENFIPIINVTTFADYEREFSARIRKSENYNFQGKIVRLGFHEVAAVSEKLVHMSENNTKISGILGDIWKMLADRSNFTLKALQPNNLDGKIITRGEVFGAMLDMIKRDEIDVIPGVLFVEPFSRLMHLTTPLWLDEYRFFIQPEFKPSDKWMLYMFARDVWLSIFAVIVLFSVIGYSTQKISHIRLRENPEYCPNFLDSLFHTFAVLCNQGEPSREKKFAIIKMLFAWLLLIVLSSNMISWLSNQSANDRPFEDFSSMLERSNFRLVSLSEESRIDPKIGREMTGISGNTDLLDEVAKSGGKYRGRIVYVPTNTVKFDLICSKKGEYTISATMVEIRSRMENTCQLIPVGRASLQAWMTSAVKVGYKNKRTFDIGIIKLREHGLIDGTTKRWIGFRTGETNVKMISLVPISFEQVSILFGALLIGATAGVIIMILEIIVHTHQNNQR